MNAFWESLYTCEGFCQVNSFLSLVKFSLFSQDDWISAGRFVFPPAGGALRLIKRKSLVWYFGLLKLRPLLDPPSRVDWHSAHPFCFCGSDVGMISWSREEKRRSPNSVSLSLSLIVSQSVMVTVVCSCSSVGFPGTDGVCSGMWVRLRFRHVWRQCLADPEHPGICETRDSRRAESCGAEPIHTSGPGHTSPGGRNNKQ